MKKGFTLIELLAVILILGIIALIAIPTINNIINEAKDSADVRTVENYKNAVDNSIMSYKLTNKLTKNTFEIINNGKNITDGTITIPVNYKGNALNNGSIVIDENNNIMLKNGTMKNKNVVYFSNNDKITFISEKDGIYYNDGKTIYRGKNPNNYIWLDENGDNNKTDTELYRIISYEKDGSIKVIRNNSLTNINPQEDEASLSFSWDTRSNSYVNNVSGITGPRQNTNNNNSYCNYSIDNPTKYKGCNVWGNQNATYVENNLLSTNFYYKYYSNSDVTDLTKSTNSSLTVINNASLNDYLNNTWLNSNSNLNNYILEHKFNVGGHMYYNGYTGGDKGLEKEKYEESLSTWLGKIGLMNATEYVEASLDKKCVDVYRSFYFNKEDYYKGPSDSSEVQHNDVWSCKEQNYLYSGHSQWTISTFPNNFSSIWMVHSSGYLNVYASYSSLTVRPTFYLKPTLNLSGAGTSADPYRAN